MPPAIFLVNQISRRGHLDMYARLYSACLLDLGYRVVLLAERESGIGEWLAARRLNRSNRFSFLCLNEPQDASDPSTGAGKAEPIASLSARLARVWQIEGIFGIARRLSHRARRPFEAVRSAMVSGYRRARGLAAVGDSGFSFRPIVERIRAARDQLGIEPALVVFLYLDMMNEDPSGCRSLSDHLGSPWAGILFHPRCNHDKGEQAPEAYFFCSNARGAAFLNPAWVGEYARRFPSLIFGALPDVTEAECSQAIHDLAKQLRERAAGRTIVLLAGSIMPHKGVMEFIEVIDRADRRAFFFAIIGEVFWEAFSEDKERLREFYAAPPENCLVQAGYIEREGDFNSVLAAADIIYAVYEDWRNSSNSLTKASLLEKPILVSEGDLMGQRVGQYLIGACVRFGDIDGIVAALEELRQKPASDFGFADFCREHSIDALRECLAALVADWIQSEATARAPSRISSRARQE